MKTQSTAVKMLAITLLTSFLVVIGVSIAQEKTAQENPTPATSNSATNLKTAIFAGGCFWCIEADFEKLNGVNAVVSGYSGGAANTADYKTVSYTETGHFEAVEVSYDPDKVTYSELVEYFWRHIDPTNARGQFCDSGSSYRSGIFYGSDEEQAIVEKSLANLKANKPFKGDIVTIIDGAKPFYLAEEYHQDYYKKNPVRYGFYRRGCGRDARVAQLWGEKK